MLCSLAAAAIFAVPTEAQQPVYGGGLRSKPAMQGSAGASPVQRPVATFATPYPTRPSPGPVRTVYDQPGSQQQPQQMPAMQAQGSRPAAYTPRPGGAAAPGAAGKALYFHKSENATTPDGMADSSTVAMASSQDPIPEIGVPDVSAVLPGVPQAVVVPATVITMPIVPPSFEPVLPPNQPFVPTTPDVTVPAFPETTRTVGQPEEKKPDPKDPTKLPMPELNPEVTQLPSRAAIFTMFDNQTLERGIRRSVMEQHNKTKPEQPKVLDDMILFPALKPTVPPGTQFVSKTTNLEPKQLIYEPGFIVHRRLHFEEKNSERYGWDLGLMSPFVSTASFYKNLILWPSSLASVVVVGSSDTNMGKCLPGSPTPYYLYPQGLTITGGVAEGLVITGLSFVIP